MYVALQTEQPNMVITAGQQGPMSFSAAHYFVAQTLHTNMFRIMSHCRSLKKNISTGTMTKR